MEVKEEKAVLPEKTYSFITSIIRFIDEQDKLNNPNKKGEENHEN